jgi:hypothetical protein
VPRGDLSSSFAEGYDTIPFNRKHTEFGHLFSGRYKALPVDGSGDGYLKAVCDYVQWYLGSEEIRQSCLSPLATIAFTGRRKPDPALRRPRFWKQTRGIATFSCKNPVPFGLLD